MRSHGRLAASVLWMMGLTLMACASDEPSRTPVVIRDSAGISIVENWEPVWPEPRWTVPNEPVLELGGPSGDVLVNPTDAMRLADGQVLITDDGGKDVRVFSASGQLLQTIGRQGSGPGEFQSVSQIDHFRSDSFMVYDYMQQQVSVFDMAGKFGRSLRVTTAGFNWVEGVVADSLIFMMSSPASMPRNEPGLYWDSTAFLVKGEAPGLDTVGRYPFMEMLGQPSSSSRQYYFGPRAQHAADADRLVWGSSKAYEILELDLTGHLVRRISRPFTPRLITAATIDSFKTRYTAYVSANARRSTEGGRGRMQTILDQALYADQMPAYSALLLDVEGNIWAEDYRHYTEPQSQWSVFDPTGRWLGTVVMPNGITLLEVGADYILGSATDDMGVRYIRVYALDKEGGAP